MLTSSKMVVNIFSKKGESPQPDSPCPCCGWLVFHKKDIGNYSICPICFWEYEPIRPDEIDQETGGPNGISLYVARLNYKKIGASKKESINKVRQPKENESRYPSWDEVVKENRVIL